MKLIKNKTILTATILIGLLVFILGINQFLLVEKAHSSFKNYYDFRGCTELIQKTSDFALCKIPSGQTIKIVKFHDKWYLDNDLPNCISNFCW